jgi:radical SAM superfamily enzyme YgiQ (UPF0313 family)
MKSEDIKNILFRTYNSGIRIHTTLIVGFPGEKYEEALNTAAFMKDILKKMANSICWVNKFVLYKNTEVYNNPQLYNIEIQDEHKRLDGICEFKYVNGDYSKKDVLQETYTAVVNQIYNELGWKNFNKNKFIFDIIKLYFFTSHGFILKENNKLLPEDIEKALSEAKTILF